MSAVRALPSAPGAVRVAGPRESASGSTAVSHRLRGPFLLLLVWLVFEFGRPPATFKIPLIISVVLFLVWLSKSDKQITEVSWGWLALLGVMVLGIPLAANTFAAVMETRTMAILFLCVCLPLQALVNSAQRFRAWVYTFLGISLVVGAWATTHGGYGPSGASGGQDENYVAALMGMSIALAYFSLFAEKRRFLRLILGGSIIVFVAAIALAQNASRGGFLGLCAVALYCLARSPRKVLGLGMLSVAAVAMAVIAGPVFWAEIRTTTDVDSPTADLRIEIWKIGLRMWQANPLTGVGAGNFRWVIGNYQSAEQLEKYGRDFGGSVIAHSLPVELLAELGIAGLIVVAFLVVRTWTNLGKVRQGSEQGSRWLDADPYAIRCYADALRGAMVAILVNGVFLSLMYYSHLWLLIAMGSALSFAYRPGPRTSQPLVKGTRSVAPQRGRAVAGAGLRTRVPDAGRNGHRRRR